MKKIYPILVICVLFLSSFSGCFGKKENEGEGAGATGWVYGFAKDEKDSSLSDVTISVNGRSVKTDDKGSYNITNLSPNTYNVTASCQGYISVSKDVVVSAGKGTRTDFILKLEVYTQKGWIYGDVKNEADIPLPNVSILLNGTEKAKTNESGEFNITVEPGKYNVTASLEGYESSSQTVSVQAGKAEKVDFILRMFIIEEPDKGFTTWVDETDKITSAVAAPGGTTVITEKQGPTTTLEWWGYWKLLPGDKNFSRFGPLFRAYITWEKGAVCDFLGLRYFREGESVYIIVQPKEVGDHWKLFEFNCTSDFAEKKWYIGVYPMLEDGTEEGVETDMPYTIVIKNNAGG